TRTRSGPTRSTISGVVWATEGQQLEGPDSIAHQTDATSPRLADPTEVSPSSITVREQPRARDDLRHRMRSDLVADDGRRREPPKAPVLGVETLGLTGIAVQLPRQRADRIAKSVVHERIGREPERNTV